MSNNQSNIATIPTTPKPQTSKEVIAANWRARSFVPVDELV
jgi:hypothetical protein